MNSVCTKTKDYIYLYGEGELTDPEIKLLKAHLSECRYCYLEYQSVLGFKKIVDTSASHIPEHYFTSTHIERILSGINNSATVSAKEKFFEWFLDLFSRPVLRLSMTFLILVLTGTFLFQGSITLSDISKLEKKMLNNSYPQKTSAAVLEPDKITRNLKDFYLFIKGDNSYLNISSNLLIIDRDVFRNLFRIHNLLMNHYNKDPRDFSKKYPELTRYLLEQMEPEEIDSVLTNGDLINDLNNILIRGK